jgi:hypothetical protein
LFTLLFTLWKSKSFLYTPLTSWSPTLISCRTKWLLLVCYVSVFPLTKGKR